MLQLQLYTVEDSEESWGGGREVKPQAILGAPRSQDRSCEELMDKFCLSGPAPPFLFLLSVLGYGVPGLRSLACFSESKALARMDDHALGLPRTKYRALGQGEPPGPSCKTVFLTVEITVRSSVPSGGQPTLHIGHSEEQNILHRFFLTSTDRLCALFLISVQLSRV